MSSTNVFFMEVISKDMLPYVSNGHREHAICMVFGHYDEKGLESTMDIFHCLCILSDYEGCSFPCGLNVISSVISNRIKAIHAGM
jgi:hypothetical protein